MRVHRHLAKITDGTLLKQSVTVEVGAGGPKVLGWRVDRYWVLDDGLGDTRGDGGQIAREDVLFARDRIG
jgi:hypothetical protein